MSLYLGRPVNPKHFRVFVYDALGNKKLCNSWKEFEKALATGDWFAEKNRKDEKVFVLSRKTVDTVDEVNKAIDCIEKKPKSKRKRKSQ